MKKEVKVGLFAIAVLLVGWGVARMLKGAEIFSNSYTYYAYYTQVGGIQPASHVMISGVKVGSVVDVKLNEDPSKGVELTLSIDKQYRIPTDSKAEIFSDGLMGGKAVKILYGSSSEFTPNKGTIQSKESVDLMDMASTELTGLLEKVKGIMDNLAVTLNGINGLMAQNTETITHIMSNVDGLTGNVNSMLANEKQHLEQAFASLSEFSKALGDNASEVDAIIDNMSAFSGKLAESNLVTEIEGVVNNLNDVLASVNDKNGSIGKMLSDAELYDNLTSASNNLSVLLEDLKENPSRYVQVSVFGGKNPEHKVAKAKAKAEKRAIKRADEAAEREAELAKKQAK
ncbi:MAG: MCE family protein [Alistipes sp.]|jgi:phospholipid/cholesterol/gamma-HCH transport system substrate-binding protein|nr:MCE family protein [Alistipes sp.]MBQ5914367.1 MCE family protein [Alistipes sp.]